MSSFRSLRTCVDDPSTPTLITRYPSKRACPGHICHIHGHILKKEIRKYILHMNIKPIFMTFKIVTLLS